MAQPKKQTPAAVQAAGAAFCKTNCVIGTVDEYQILRRNAIWSISKEETPAPVCDAGVTRRRLGVAGNQGENNSVYSKLDYESQKCRALVCGHFGCKGLFVQRQARFHAS